MRWTRRTRLFTDGPMSGVDAEARGTRIRRKDQNMRGCTLPPLPYLGRHRTQRRYGHVLDVTCLSSRRNSLQRMQSKFVADAYRQTGLTHPLSTRSQKCRRHGRSKSKSDAKQTSVFPLQYYVGTPPYHPPYHSGLFHTRDSESRNHGRSGGRRADGGALSSIAGGE